MKKFLIVSLTLVSFGLGSVMAADEAGDKPKGKGKGGDPAKRVEMMMKKADTNADEKLSAEELTAFFEAMPKRPDAPEKKGPGAAERAAKMVERGDTDSDSLLSKEELVAAMKKGPRGEGKPGKPGKPGEKKPKAA